jgi:hypothetical protein
MDMSSELNQQAASQILAEDDHQPGGNKQEKGDNRQQMNDSLKDGENIDFFPVMGKYLRPEQQIVDNKDSGDTQQDRQEYIF